MQHLLCIPLGTGTVLYIGTFVYTDILQYILLQYYATCTTIYTGVFMYIKQQHNVFEYNHDMHVKVIVARDNYTQNELLLNTI